MPCAGVRRYGGLRWAADTGGEDESVRRFGGARNGTTSKCRWQARGSQLRWHFGRVVVAVVEVLVLVGWAFGGLAGIADYERLSWRGRGSAGSVRNDEDKLRK